MRPIEVRTLLKLGDGLQRVGDQLRATPMWTEHLAPGFQKGRSRHRPKDMPEADTACHALA